jgi:hypothetical protein
MELARLFCDMFAGTASGNGVVLCLQSASHLATVGLEAYTEDFVKANKMLRDKFEGVNVLVGPPLLLDGSEDHQFIQAILELGAWVDNFRDFRERHLGKTWKLVVDDLCERGEGNTYTPPHRYRLPVGANTWEKKGWASSGWKNSPLRVAPLDLGRTMTLVRAFIAEMNASFPLNLALDFRMEGGKVAAAPPSQLIVIGASLAQRTANSLQAAGMEVKKITMPSWRPTPGTVATACEELTDAIKQMPSAAVVFQLFDSAAYYAGCEDGSIIPMRRDPGGRFHVDGELVMATGDLFTRTLKICLPLFKACAGANKIVLSPLPRYWQGRCCADKEHVANLESGDYEATLFKGLDHLRDISKGFLRSSGVDKLKVVSTFQLMTTLEGGRSTTTAHMDNIRQEWGPDPVHPQVALFDRVAKSLPALLPNSQRGPTSGFLPPSCRWLTDLDWAPQKSTPSRGRGRGSSHRMKPY